MVCVVVGVVAGVTQGLSEFGPNSEGVPEADLVDEFDKEDVVPLFSIQAMRWMDLCIGAFPFMHKRTSLKIMVLTACQHTYNV